MICPGLNLRVGTTRKTWSVYHRTGGRLKQSKLGYFPAMALADARKAARELLERLAAGAPPLPPEPHPSASLTLGGLIDRYQAHRRRKGGRGTKSLAQSIRVVRNGLKDYLALPAASFSKHDLRVARDVIAARAPTAANRTQAYLSPILRWAEAEDLIPYDFSRAVIRVGREVKRDRILSHHEIKAVWAACDKLDDTIEQRSYARLVRFLLLTGDAARQPVSSMAMSLVAFGARAPTATRLGENTNCDYLFRRSAYSGSALPISGASLGRPAGPSRVLGRG